MTQARSEQVDLDSTPFYHCIVRCVRRAFLCGDDPHSKKNFDHRKEWVLRRLKFLAQVFAVDICAYAVLSNHFHVLPRINRELALSWSEEEVLQRYERVFKNARTKLEPLADDARAGRIELYRRRLYDLSWFMRCLNEHIARRANQEDGCTGRFWEGRFKSQPLLDEIAVLTCMSYVDLNPVRAGVSSSLEDSDFTSIQERLREEANRSDVTARGDAVSGSLVRFHEEPPRWVGDEVLPMTLPDYVRLLDWTGRASHPSKTGSVSGPPPKLLGQMGVNPEAWLRTMRGSRLSSLSTIGGPGQLEQLARRRGAKWVCGKRWAQGLYAA